MTAPQFPPRVWANCYQEPMDEGWYFSVEKPFSFAPINGHDYEYLSLSEHESLLREAVAKAESEIWAEAVIMTAQHLYESGFVKCGELSDAFAEKARESRNET